MQPGDAFRVVYLRRNSGNGNGRGIAGEQRLRRTNLCQLGKQRLFHFKPLGGRLDHQIGFRQSTDIRHRRQAGEDLLPGVGREFSTRNA